jgi:hypothetical protein
MKKRHTTRNRTNSTSHRVRPLRAKSAPRRADESTRPANPYALQRFEPDPAGVYNLETVAQLSGVPRRTILIYCKHKLISFVPDPATLGYSFTTNALRTLRQIQDLRPRCSNELQSLATVLNLLEEIKNLRAEIRGRENRF